MWLQPQLRLWPPKSLGGKNAMNSCSEVSEVSTCYFSEDDKPLSQIDKPLLLHTSLSCQCHLLISGAPLIKRIQCIIWEWKSRLSLTEVAWNLASHSDVWSRLLALRSAVPELMNQKQVFGKHKHKHSWSRMLVTSASAIVNSGRGYGVKKCFKWWSFISRYLHCIALIPRRVQEVVAEPADGHSAAIEILRPLHRGSRRDQRGFSEKVTGHGDAI